MGLTLIVGDNVNSIMSTEKSLVWPSMLEEFVNDTGSCSIHHINRTWCGGPSKITTGGRCYLRVSYARVLMQSFDSGMVSVFSISKILG